MRKSVQKSFILLLSLVFVGLMAPAAVSAASSPGVRYQTHIENIGWESDAGIVWRSNGEMSGTQARSLRLEGIKINLTDTQGYDLGIAYQTHIQNIGWESDAGIGWQSNGDMSGTYGRSLRLEAIQIKLTGADADKFNIFYQVHAQNIGWMGWAKNGESAGTAGFSYRLEAIRIVIVPAGSAAPGNTSKAFVEHNGKYIFNEKINTGKWLDFAYFPKKMVRTWTFNQDGTGVLIENQAVISTYNYSITDVSEDGSSGKVTIIGPNIDTTKNIVFSYFNDGDIKMIMEGKTLWIFGTREI